MAGWDVIHVSCFISILSRCIMVQTVTTSLDVSIHTKCKVWNTTLKKCTECDVGFQGDSCQMVCRYPNYVNQCQMWCNCEQRNCSFVTGCDYGSPTISPSIMEISFPVYLLTKTLKACRSGYTGSDCESACRYPSYGVGCQLQCKCDKNICHYVKGCETYTHCSQSERPRKKCTVP
ncbi:multiple epidermal growth factor-like domains protein 10 isoform X3 [Ostrea edulis]|uniref:multiple epidermal growth factor-like domains protein 10 isoform X3 n=1 Tax=Ostrea edulis TaxID=37623 RepID=UPI0024AFA20F|nr:multiple epidermal growth factor-like domains protein 10 isoform X3 [Ostrea edulis]